MSLMVDFAKLEYKNKSSIWISPNNHQGSVKNTHGLLFTINIEF